MRRALLSILAAASLAVSGLVSAGTASAQGVAMSVDGWARSEAATGTVFYRCTAVASCGQGATVSYRKQADGPLSSLATYRTQNETVDRNLIERSAGRVLSIDILEVIETEVAGAKVQTAVKVITQAGGQREYLTSTRFSDGQRHYSLVSSGPDERVVRANLAVFLPVVMLAAQIGGKPAPAR
ncbi:hypothetical protein [Phreatobacter stygius]|uniref:Uncharacterized protein n=1 Tax=Phreatobacter stygius TaxID=1940610 RepID=A0A4D7AV78_9HYPH|nr:hypothetical protein [Phreatobacter stygius]QCI62888.1 hypothetical protein E8M01_00680 [Phreatobacter stygius]